MKGSWVLTPAAEYQKYKKMTKEPLLFLPLATFLSNFQFDKQNSHLFWVSSVISFYMVIHCKLRWRTGEFEGVWVYIFGNKNMPCNFLCSWPSQANCPNYLQHSNTQWTNGPELQARSLSLFHSALEVDNRGVEKAFFSLIPKKKASLTLFLFFCQLFPSWCRFPNSRNQKIKGSSWPDTKLFRNEVKREWKIQERCCTVQKNTAKKKKKKIWQVNSDETRLYMSPKVFFCFDLWRLWVLPEQPYKT